MTILSQQDHIPAGMISNNTLAMPDGTLIGILLGHCVFNKEGKVKAKYFNHTLYALDGRILAKEKKTQAAIHLEAKFSVRNAWEFIQNIKDHSCPLIEPTETWAPVALKEFFNE
ncbi:hypothetical protein [Flavihumibacter solisilvae]|uniref:Uncharacterized protein n=1 Tax=Flavihumibacter solisilvae TaxID=1349421 RepID=A0A0C1IHB3_9BACT|nr:hypothetical protein [Flavihumibacter solisilvae]KIC93575.1 hypothetical protein OI18_17750 [Flavihumibacter solisilvae]